MNIPLRITVVVSGFFLAALTIYAGTPGLVGNVKDANGSPLSGAQVRVEGKDASSATVVQTDRNGHYVFPLTGTGTFNVTLIVNGTVKACITNVHMTPGSTETLNFALTKRSVQPSAAGKHYVWVPGATGTNIPGRWVEVDQQPKQSSLGMTERQNRAGSEMVQHIQDKSSDFGSSH